MKFDTIRMLLEVADYKAWLVAMISFSNTDKKEGTAFFVFPLKSREEAKEALAHAEKVNINELDDALDHMVQNTIGGHFLPGSAHVQSAKISTTDRDGAKFFHGNLGDFLAA